MSAIPFVDDAFWPLLVADARAWGADPRVIAQVMMSESALDPEAVNPAQRDASGKAIGGRPNLFAGDPSAACIGLNQLCPVNHGLFAPLSPEQYQQLPASEQWKAGAGKFFDAQLRAHPEAGQDVAALYWLNYKPSTYVKGAPDDYAIGPDPSNPGLILPGASTVTPAGLRHFATRDASSTQWKSVLAAIDSVEGAHPVPPAPATAPGIAPALAGSHAALVAESVPVPLVVIVAYLGIKLLGNVASHARYRRIAG